MKHADKTVVSVRVYLCEDRHGGASEEIVAENASRARYRFWGRISEFCGSKLQDIKVTSLAGRRAHPMAEGWEYRLETANRIIKIIAAHGRKFFSENSDRESPVENPFISSFFVDLPGELWFIDRYSRWPVFVRHDPGKWHKFTDGGTLQRVVLHLAEHIWTGSPVRLGYFSPSPSYLCGGDIWGYGDDMVKVRDAVAAILPQEKFLIFNYDRDRTRGYNDGCVLWWGPNGGGYSNFIEGAGRFTVEQAVSICQGSRGQLRMVSERDVMAVAKSRTYCWIQDLPKESYAPVPEKVGSLADGKEIRS